MRCMVCGKFFPEPNDRQYTLDTTYGICHSCDLKYPKEKVR